MNDPNVIKNKYRQAVDPVVPDDSLKARISSAVVSHEMDREPIGFRGINVVKGVLAAASIVLILAASIYISLSYSYPVSPKGVVRRYIHAVKNEDIDEAMWFVQAGVDESMTGTSGVLMDFDDFNRIAQYSVSRYGEDDSMRLVEVRYGSELIESYILERTDGRWRIKGTAED